MPDTTKNIPKFRTKEFCLTIFRNLVENIIEEQRGGVLSSTAQSNPREILLKNMPCLLHIACSIKIQHIDHTSVFSPLSFVNIVKQIIMLNKSWKYKYCNRQYK